MNRLKAALCIAVACGLGGCGGGGGGSTAPDVAPVITHLRYTPGFELQLPGETATVTGSVDFTDAGGNVAEMRITTAAGATTTVPLDLGSASSGTATGRFTVPLDRIGQTDFELWLVDRAGHASNRLAGSVEVRVNDTAPRWRAAPGQAALTRLLDARELRAGVWTGTRFVFVGQLVATSPDLRTWSESAIPPDVRLDSVAWSGTGLVAVGSRWLSDHAQAVVLHSTNGSQWTVVQVVDRCPAGDPAPPCTYQAGLSKVIWAGTRFVAVGRETVPGSGTFALVLTSPDGTAWTQQAADRVPVGADLAANSGIYGLGLSSVAWSGSQFVAVGRAVDGRAAAWRSADTRTWTPVALPALASFTVRDVVWGHGRFVAVGWGGLVEPVEVQTTATLTSTNGTDWATNQGSLPLAELRAVGVGPTRFLTASTTEWHTSTDGRQWLTRPVGSGPQQGTVWDGERWVGVGSYEVWVSP